VPINLSLGRLHEKLKGIKQVINIYPKQKGQGNRKERKIRTLTKMDEIQEKLFEVLKTKTQAKKHHLQDEKYKEKIKRPIRSC